MNIQDFMLISSQGIQTALMVSAPALLLGLAAGIAVSVFQAATQINDAALAFIPKILATTFALLYFGNWMISEMASFAIHAFSQIPIITQ